MQMNLHPAELFAEWSEAEILEKLLNIISGCANQERQSQQMLYDQYYGLCLKVAFRYVNTYEQAVEVSCKGAPAT